jgi:hypothetical protein
MKSMTSTSAASASSASSSSAANAPAGLAQASSGASASVAARPRSMPELLVRSGAGANATQAHPSARTPLASDGGDHANPVAAGDELAGDAQG